MRRLEDQDYDEEGIKSQEDDEPDFRTLHRKARESQKDSKTLAPSENNMTLSMKQGQELVEIMKARGFEMNEAELKKMKSKQTEIGKSAPTKVKSGFFDGGHSATLEQLFAALNKAYNQNDTQQASCVLSYILERKQLEKKDRNKFGLMKCNLLFNHGAYQQCIKRATELLQQPFSDLSAAILSTYLTKSKAQLNRVWEGYIDLERAKSLLIDLKLKKQLDISEGKQDNNQSNYVDTQLDAVIRDLSTAQLEYTMRMNKQKIIANMIEPLHSQFKNRRVHSISCGDHHALFLAGGSYDQDIRRIDERGKWKTQVFGIGQNSAGQVMGRLYEKNPCSNQPILIKQLSGKGITGIFCNKQSSIAYDQTGNIYEWGVKTFSETKNIEISYRLNKSIKKLQKGNQHFAALTQSGQFYIWGIIEHKQAQIFAQKYPTKPKIASSVIDFSCGNSTIVVITKQKELFGMGSNQANQLNSTDNCCRQFSKIDTTKIGNVKKVFALNDCTFALTEDQELYYRGRYSFKKQIATNWKLAEFTQEMQQIISVSGFTGTYYVTNQNGQIYRWSVDSSVKFRKHVQYQKSTPRIVQCSRGKEYRLKTLPQPQLCLAKVITKSLKTYTPIIVEISLRDKLGIYGLELPQSLKINMCLTKKHINSQDLIGSSEKFIKLTGNKYTKNEVYLDEIIQNNLLSYTLVNSEYSSKILVEVMVEKADEYNLYILIDSIPVSGSPLKLEVDQSEKEAELEKKMLQERQKKKRLLEERKRKEEEAKRLEEEDRLREFEKKKQTDKRAEEALRKHMRDQQQERTRAEEQRKRKAELQTGGGFDLSKIKSKNSNPDITQKKQIRQPQEIKQVKEVRASRQLKNEDYKGKVPQLPDINVRPSSKRKLVLKKTETPTFAPSSTNTVGTLKSTLLRRGDSKSKKPS